MLALQLQYLGHLVWKVDSLEKTLMLGKIEGNGRSRVTEAEKVGWHHPLNGHEFGQTPRDSEGQGSLACCSPWGHKESNTTTTIRKGTLVAKFQFPKDLNIPVTTQSTFRSNLQMAVTSDPTWGHNLTEAWTPTFSVAWWSLLPPTLSGLSVYERVIYGSKCFQLSSQK